MQNDARAVEGQVAPVIDRLVLLGPDAVPALHVPVLVLVVMQMERPLLQDR